MASQEVLTALETLHREIEKLEPAIKHVETAIAVTKIVKDIPQKHIDLINQIRESHQNHKKELSDIFSQELRLLSEEFRKIGKDTEEIQKQVKYEQKYLAELREKATKLYEGIDKINFPERLDKLDANVAGIMAAVQAIQGRLDIVERNISDKIRDLIDNQKEVKVFFQNELNNLLSVIQQQIDDKAKQQLRWNIITWGIIILIGAITLLKLFQIIL